MTHAALLYADWRELLDGCGTFIEDGHRAGEPMMVALRGDRLAALRATLGDSAHRVRFADMSRLGRNPGRIIPEVRDWADGHGGRRCRLISEPIWPGRSPGETIEAIRHEALINLAFADVPATILCPYEIGGLHPSVLADAERTHPRLVCGGQERISERYADPLELWRARDWTLPDPDGAIVAESDVTGDLHSIRELVAACGRRAGLGGLRLQDLVLAVDEAAANSLQHGAPPGRLRVWQAGGRLVCEIADAGRIADPLAGRRRPAPDWPSGRGLWLVNQLCDLVELRPEERGTTIRLHVNV